MSTNISISTTGGTTITSQSTGTTLATSARGPAGVGVPPGGTAGQVLKKVDGEDYNTEWEDESGGGGGGGFTQEQIEDFLANSFIVGGTNVTVTYDDGADTLTFSVTSFPWASLTGVPSEFTPESHTHALSEITDAGTAAGRDEDYFALSAHLHGTADISGLDSALSARVTTSTYNAHVAETEAHGISAFGSTLVGDASASEARGTLGLGTAATSDTGDFAPVSHAHTASQITDFNAEVDARIPSEVNDLTSSVTWADIPDANVPESAVSQHQGALSIAESQIPDGTVLRRFTDTVRLATYGKGATGTEAELEIPMEHDGQITGLRWALTASDSGTVKVRVRNSSGTMQSEATVIITTSQRGASLSLTWSGPEGDGSFSAGDFITIEPDTGFASAGEGSAFKVQGTRSS